MAFSLRKRGTLHLPITLSVALMTLNIALMVIWIVLFAKLDQVPLLAIGTIAFSLILVGLTIYLILTIKAIRLNRRQANFVDSVTHELKTPIASLRLYLETLQMRSLTPEQCTHFYGVMETQLQRLDGLINQLLEVGRLDAIGHHSQPEDLQLEPLLRRCASTACTNHNHEAENVFTFDAAPVIVNARRMVVEMIFGNLFDNAVKYGAEKPHVDVEVRVKNRGRVVVRISDNGQGVPAEHRTKIFKLFYRGENELERTKKGTGLGLYIVRTLVHILKGKISVYDRVVGPGSVFEVELPGEDCSMRILVVEDEEAMAAGLKFNFEQEGYDVVTAGDGPTALAHFQNAEKPPFNLVILDLMLPGMSGYETCKEIRKFNSEVPILVLSARSLSEDRIMAFDCGTDQYLTKPFALPELLSRVRNLTFRRRVNGGPAESVQIASLYRFQNVEVDFDKFEIRVADRRYSPTTMEMELLRFFIENEGKVLSRADILERVWGEDSNVTTRTIDNFVLRLRKMIEANPSDPVHIVSMRGTGYRFVARP